MYKRSSQLSISDFVFPYGALSEDNRWVRLAGPMPWGRADKERSGPFVNNGAPAHPSRMALGSLIAKQMLECSDEELCRQVAENPYLQYFVGMKELSDECPFGAPALVAFRKRFTEADIARINDWAIEAQGGGGGDGTGADAVALDAAVAPSHIRCPTGASLLNEAREKPGRVIDSICAQTGGARPRTYRRRARKECLNWSKSTKKTAKC
jgi:hypothetical protein